MLAALDATQVGALILAGVALLAIIRALFTMEPPQEKPMTEALARVLRGEAPSPKVSGGLRAKLVDEIPTLDVVGESHYRPAFAEIFGPRTENGVDAYVRAELVLDDDNPYDNQAVRVEIRGRQVGHLSRGDARVFRDMLRAGGRADRSLTAAAHVRGGWDRGAGDRGDYGVKILLDKDPCESGADPPPAPAPPPSTGRTS